MNYAIMGLGFGDEGKGTITDYLTNKYNADINIRYNGGCQAAHNVVLENGKHHCFSQFGSGTLSNNTITYLSEYMLVNPFSIIIENEHLIEIGINNALERLYICNEALVVTPIHKAVGQILEKLRGQSKHSSVGMGVGQAMLDAQCFKSMALRMKDLLDANSLKYKLNYLYAVKMDYIEQIITEDVPNEVLERFKELSDTNYVSMLTERYLELMKKYKLNIVKDITDVISLKDKTIVFEGAQGFLLDCNHGFKPYITKTDITLNNANLLSMKYHLKDAKKIGILRAYATRHGNGPFVSEDLSIENTLIEYHNCQNEWQGKFRLGWFDLVSAKYALLINDIDKLAITCLDRLSTFKKIKICTCYKYNGVLDDSFKEQFEWEQKGDEILIKAIIKNTGNITSYLEKCKPIYEELNGWCKDISNVESYDELPSEAKNMINYIEQNLCKKVGIISVGMSKNNKFEV